MPYVSDAQRKFMHARKPKIAAKWDAEIRTKKLKVTEEKPEKVKTQPGAVSKVAPDVGRLVKVRNSVADNIAAVQDARDKKARLRGRIKKMHAPVINDPSYNSAAAQRAYDLVMKMDDDTAEMFCTIVAADLFEQEVERNLSTLQRHLNTVVAKRHADVKQAIAKHADDPRAQAYWEALEAVTKADKNTGTTGRHTPQYYGYEWDPNDFRRDPSTGRFMVKIKQTMTKPLKEKEASRLIGDTGKAIKDDKRRAQYQDEYRQVASFLEMFEQISPQKGDMDVIYHLRDGAGNHFQRVDNAGSPSKTILGDEETTLVALEAKPTTLTTGGTAFGLAHAMGRSMTPEQMGRINRSDAEFKTFSNDWAASSAATKNQNDPLYGRLSSAGKLMGTLGPPGSKVQLAGGMAEVVGRYGPQAEQVIGPTARKTAYRYRGTETAPDEILAEVYGSEIADAKKYGVTKPTPDMQRRIADQLKTTRQRMTGVPGAGRGDMVSQQTRRAVGPRERREEAVAPSIMQVAQIHAADMAAAGRTPTWAERGAGTAVVTEYLRLKVPSQKLYNLHVESGNTPPSEGVIIDSQGRLAVQAIGYGDDHYLPFNLKNLKQLKGGEYVRNRSVGGLTSEDIYTGLMTGARRVTVVSRSGTFSMEFSDDFRGGRRHNDKARRMTRRYEQILDSVQSGKVDRQQIPYHWRKAIENEVRSEYPNADRVFVRDMITERIKEFKDSPEIEGRDEERAESLIADFQAQADRGEVSEEAARDFRSQIYNELRDMKEVRFRLNGIGYDAALKSLQEQFPYYIVDVRNRPTRREDNLEFEQDKGYVEPGRNRPTHVRAGWHGTDENPGTKFSASHADYQQGLTGNKLKRGTPVADTADAATTTEGEEEAKRAGFKALTPEEAAKRKLRDQDAQENKELTARKAGVALFSHIKKVSAFTFETGQEPVWWSMTPEQLDPWLKDRTNFKQFSDFMDAHEEEFGGTATTQGKVPNYGPPWLRFKTARGMTQATPFQKTIAQAWPEYPYTFPNDPDPAYHAGATRSQVHAAMQEIARTDKHAVTSTAALRDFSPQELEDELGATDKLLGRLHPSGGVEAAPKKIVLEEHRRVWPHSPSTDELAKVATEKLLTKHMENIHRIRYLQIMEAESAEEKAATIPPGRRANPVRQGGSTPPSRPGGSTPPSSPPGGSTPTKPKPAGGGSTGVLDPIPGQFDDLGTTGQQQFRETYIKAADEALREHYNELLAPGLEDKKQKSTEMDQMRDFRDTLAANPNRKVSPAIIKAMLDNKNRFGAASHLISWKVPAEWQFDEYKPH